MRKEKNTIKVRKKEKNEKISNLHIRIFIFFAINSIAKNNCSELDKLSKEYAKCIKKKIDDSLKETGVKKKI